MLHQGFVRKSFQRHTIFHGEARLARPYLQIRYYDLYFHSAALHIKLWLELQGV